MVKKESEKRRYPAAGNLWFVLQGLRRYSHYWLFWCCINTLFGTILPFIAVFLPKLLIDELTGLQRVPMFTSLLLGAAGATIVCSIFVQAGSNYQWPHSALLRCRLMLLRGNKAMAIDYKLTENADFLSKFENARKATGERVNIDRDSLMEYCNAIYFAPSYVLAFAGYSVIIFTLHPLILALLVAGLLVSYRIGVWYDKLEYQSMERRRYPRVRLRRLPEKILCRLPGFWSHCCELTGKHLPCQRRT
jgi:ATP-binding cassette subfamily C protein